MKVAIYTRVSTADQTIEPQLIELRQNIKSRGWTIVAEFTDTISGTIEDRGGLKALMDLVKSGQIYAVCAVKIDRIARSVGHLVSLSDQFVKYGVAIVIPMQGIDTSSGSACGRMQMQILAVMAEFERSLIVERTMAGLAAARARGKVLGRPSPKMVGVNREAVVKKWLTENEGESYAKLGEMLGGVSAATAWRVARRIMPKKPAIAPSMEVVDE